MTLQFYFLFDDHITVQSNTKKTDKFICDNITIKLGMVADAQGKIWMHFFYRPSVFNFWVAIFPDQNQLRSELSSKLVFPENKSQF